MLNPKAQARVNAVADAIQLALNILVANLNGAKAPVTPAPVVP